MRSFVSRRRAQKIAGDDLSAKCTQKAGKIRQRRIKLSAPIIKQSSAFFSEPQRDIKMQNENENENENDELNERRRKIKKMDLGV